MGMRVPHAGSLQAIQVRHRGLCNRIWPEPIDDQHDYKRRPVTCRRQYGKAPQEKEDRSFHDCRREPSFSHEVNGWRMTGALLGRKAGNDSIRVWLHDGGPFPGFRELSTLASVRNISARIEQVRQRERGNGDSAKYTEA